MSSNNEEQRYLKIKRGIQNNYGKLLLLVIIFAITIFAVWNMSATLAQFKRLISVLSPFVIAIFLAYLIAPLIEVIKKGLNRFFFRGKGTRACWYLSIILSYLIIVGIIIVTLVYILPEVARSIRDLDFQRLFVQAKKEISEFLYKLPFLNSVVINKKLNELQPTFWEYGKDYVFPAVYGFSKSIITTLVNIILSIVISCYIIIEKENLTAQLKRLIFALCKKGNGDEIWKTLHECNHIFNGFLIGKTIDSLIIGILCFVSMTILQLPYAILLSIIVGVTNMIPYFGPFVGAVPGVLIYLLLNPRLAIIFAILILILQQFDGLYLGPKILGDLTGLTPLWVILAITVGGAYFGVLGMFLGVPVTAVISYLLNKFIKKKLIQKDIHMDT